MDFLQVSFCHLYWTFLSRTQVRIGNILLGKLLQSAPHGLETGQQRAGSAAELSHKRIDVLKTFATTKVTEEERGKNTSMTEGIAAASAQDRFDKFFKAQLKKDVHNVINSSERSDVLVFN